MNRYISLGIAMLAGIGIGAAAVGGLHAQAKPKAYSVTEGEVLDATALAAYGPLVTAAYSSVGGHSLNTGGKIVALLGDAPKRVVINQWDSLEQAQAFYTSAAYKNLVPQRDKAQKVIRQYIVEAVN